jgi:thiamine-phosphate diphosphorylase
VCIVSDARRLVGPRADSRVCLVELARRAVDAGVDLLQIREPQFDAADLYAVVCAAVSLSRASRTRVVVNDRVDVAIAAGADGVHLRGDSMPAARVRELAPTPFLIGWSVHGVADLRVDQDPLDYVIAGTVFGSASKPEATAWLGVGGLAAVVAAARVPVLGIGGITVDRAAEVAGTGAAGIAAIGAFVAAGSAGHDPDCRVGPVEDVTAAFRNAFPQFDSAGRAS